MGYFLNHVFQLQITLYLFILIFFWLLEFLISPQKLKNKLSHTFLNAKFLLFVVPVQFLLSVLVLFAANYIEADKFGLMFLLPISKNSILFFIIAFVCLDFFDYLYHFMMHKTPFFWKFHQVHHSDLDVDISTTVREHPCETFIRVNYSILVICIIGATPWVLIFKQIIQSFSNIVSHSKVKLPKKTNKIISKIFVTPNTHHIHHHYQLPYTDSNFGDVLTIWDQLFSTFQKLKQSEIICGVDTNMTREDNENFKKLILRPFIKKKA
jgi:sterol desaturase/sphingolipid hydroxylase (fatty acid hydroxylase superfamily)